MAYTKDRRYNRNRRNKVDEKPFAVGDNAICGLTGQKVVLLADDGTNAFLVESMSKPREIFHASTTELSRFHVPIIESDDEEDFSPDNEY